MTNPHRLPNSNSDPVYLPEPLEDISQGRKHALVDEVVANVTKIIQTNTTADSPCTQCKNALAIGKAAALYAPALVPENLVSLCERFQFKSNASCEESYGLSTSGYIWTQVLAFADVQGLDGEYICNSLSKSFCGRPTTSPLDTRGLFPKPKPANASVSVPKASGERVKVLHLSDLHLDARYLVNSEANCSSGMCCRGDTYNSASQDQVLLPASAYGAYKCDTPYDLALAALEAVGPLTGTGGTDGDSLAWTLYTGDLVSHDATQQQSQAYLEYTETSIFSMFKSYLTGPVFAALGNHDSSPSDIAAPRSLPGRLGEQQSWNYDHLAGLWMHEGWIDAKTAAEARRHYGGYSIKTYYGLRIMSFNTGMSATHLPVTSSPYAETKTLTSDFWYHNNPLTFINTTNPDTSGVFSWMINELQHAEDHAERVWIIGHVPSGWDGSNTLLNPSNLFYQIVERYSPHVIANIFFGHTHEDQFSVYYASNGTVQDENSALMTGWIMPSVTPLTNVNSAFRMYEVDTGDFNIYEAYTFFSNVSDFPSLQGTDTGPTFQLEYSTRETYAGPAGWAPDAPLNATFWQRVTEAMEEDTALVTLHNSLQGKMSVKSPQCETRACFDAKICYMRSGSAALGSQCTQG